MLPVAAVSALRVCLLLFSLTNLTSYLMRTLRRSTAAMTNPEAAGLGAGTSCTEVSHDSEHAHSMLTACSLGASRHQSHPLRQEEGMAGSHSS